MENGNFMESQNLLAQDEIVAVVNYSAHEIADAFVKQYYEIMQGNRIEAYKFYKDQSVRSHPSADGSMKTVTTREDIDEEIMASPIMIWNPDFDTMHAQDSVMESVIVGVTGSLIDHLDVIRNFAQTFFLAPQEGGGFYLHNDFLQYIEIKENSETLPPPGDVANPLPAQQADDTLPPPGDVANPLPAQQADDIGTLIVENSETSPPLGDVANHLPAQQADDIAKDSSLETAQAPNKDQSEKSTYTEEDVDTKPKVSESLEGNNPLPTETKKKSQPSAWQSAPNIQDSNKVSYASILAKEGSGSSSTQQSLNAVGKGLPPKTEKRASTSSTIPNNGPSENIYDVKAIRVKDLPPKMTQESLLEVVKQFGPVKLKNIQIKEYAQDGYRYAFVEFDNPKSAHSAVEAGFIRFEDRVCEIQYKKISNQGGHNYNGKPQYGRGGYKNENFWSRDGEGSSSGSWGNKHTDHGNFGQHSGQARGYNNKRNRYFQDRQ